MSNEYYNATTKISRLSKAASAIINSILDSIAAGFELLPGKDALNENRVTFVAAGGTGDVITTTMTPTISSYEDGLDIKLKLSATNTGAATLNIDSLGARSIKLPNGEDPLAGDLTDNDVIHLIYNADDLTFVVQSAPRTFFSGIASLASNLTFTGDNTFSGTTTLSTVDINGGAIDGTVIGASTAANATIADLYCDSLEIGSNTVGTEEDITLSGNAVVGSPQSLNLISGRDDDTQVVAVWRYDGTSTEGTDNATSIAQFQTAAEGLSDDISVVTRALGDARYLELSGGTVTGDTSFTTVTSPVLKSDAEIVFQTNGTTEAARINTAQRFLVGKTSSDSSIVGVEMRADGRGFFTADGVNPIAVNRLSDDGVLISFSQDDTTEGSVSISGTTVSYNNFLGSHYSELDGPAAELLSGTIVEATGNLVSERFHKGDRLTKFKVSDTEASPAVYGVILGPAYEDIEIPPDGTRDARGKKLTQAERLAISEERRYPPIGGQDRNPDENRDAVRTQYMIAAIGAGHIRIGSGESPSVGDLIESAGDGTGQVQADDIMRSRTVAKITSASAVTTYPDGSFVLPCVLYSG